MFAVLGVLVALVLAQLFGPARRVQTGDRRRTSSERSAQAQPAEPTALVEPAPETPMDAAGPTHADRVFQPSSPWFSRAACEAALRGKPAHRAAGKARIGTWNLAWFPDGTAHHDKAEREHDIPWLACVIATLDVDVLAVQEVVQHTRGRAALLDLERELSARTGGDYDSVFDECPDDDRQHVGFLYDKRRVTVSDVTVLRTLNPGRSACDLRLRPGLSALFRFHGGLDLRAVSVHFDSGSAEHDYTHRQTSVEHVRELLPQLTSHKEDAIVLGDWNTMGCEACVPAVSAETELLALDATLSDFRRVPPSAACSEYYRGRGGLLDHVLVTRGTRELPADAHVETHGVCAALGCGHLRGTPTALTRLSDHCPMVLELDDRDLD